MLPGSLRAAFGAGTPRQPLTHVHQLLLRVEFLGAAVPVAVGLIHGLTLGFPILLLQLFPNIQHAQQGVLGEQGQVSAPRYPTGAVLGVWDVRGGLMAQDVPGCPWTLGWRCRPRIAPLGIWQSGGCSGSTPASAAAGAGKAGSSEHGDGQRSTVYRGARLTWIHLTLTLMIPHSHESPVTRIPSSQ